MSWQRIARAAGTWMPLSLVLFLVTVLWYEAGGSPEWERVIVYIFGMVSTVFGIAALVQIARYSFGNHPSFFILIFIYQKIFWALTMAAATLLALNDIAPYLPTPSTRFVFPIFMAAIFSRSILDLSLYFGRKYSVLDEQADPVPFRDLFASFARWRRD